MAIAKSLRRFILGFVLGASCVVPLTAWAIDSDGDGVGDSIDAFPNNIEAATDTDHDGMPDKLLHSGDFESGVLSSAWTISKTGLIGSVTVITSKPHSGTYSLQVVAGKNSNVSVSLKTMTDSQVSFYYFSQTFLAGAVSFSIDGVAQYPACQSVGTWSQCNSAVSPGSHTLQWGASAGAPTGSTGQIIVDDIKLGFPDLTEDSDDDNDGVPDYLDPEPLNPANSTTWPLDGIYKGSSVRESVQ